MKYDTRTRLLVSTSCDNIRKPDASFDFDDYDICTVPLPQKEKASLQQEL